VAQRDVTEQQPIGYWLKHADEAITGHADRVLSDNGFTRFRWQVLNIVYQAPTITRSGVFDTMQSFIDARRLDEILDGFVKEGWLIERGEGDGAQLTLTVASPNKSTPRSSTCCSAW
jgi:hypothetical protein